MSVSRGSPNPGIEPTSIKSPALAGRFFTTSTPGSPQLIIPYCILESYTILYITWKLLKSKGFPGGSVVKNPPANAWDAGDESLIPGLWRSLGEGKGNPLQYSCLTNPTDRGGWQASPWGHKRVRHDWVTKYTHTRWCILSRLTVMIVCHVYNIRSLHCISETNIMLHINSTLVIIEKILGFLGILQ